MGPIYLDGTTFRGADAERIEGQRIALVDAPAQTDPWAIFEIGLRRTLRRLGQQTDRRAVFVLDVPELGIDAAHCDYPPRVVSFLGTPFGIGTPTYAHCRIPRAEFDQRTGRYRQVVGRVLKDFPAVVLFDPTPLMCDSTWCYGSRNGHGLYSDTDHLSDYGSAYVASTLALVIENALTAAR